MIEQVKELLDYNPETGIFTWKTNVSKNVKVGSVAGTLSSGYIRIRIHGKGYYAHRLAWLLTYGTLPKDQIDHINGIRTDNRICNLRDVSIRQNNQNTIKHRNGKLIGTWYNAGMRKWQAGIKVDGKSIHLGYFPDMESGSAAYMKYLANMESK